jgi:hypothetical protein
MELFCPETYNPGYNRCANDGPGYRMNRNDKKSCALVAKNPKKLCEKHNNEPFDTCPGT